MRLAILVDHKSRTTSTGILLALGIRDIGTYRMLRQLGLPANPLRETIVVGIDATCTWFVYLWPPQLPMRPALPLPPSRSKRFRIDERLLMMTTPLRMTVPVTSPVGAILEPEEPAHR